MAQPLPPQHAPADPSERGGLSRREFVREAGMVAAAVAAAPIADAAGAAADAAGAATADADATGGTPEQVHLTFGDDPSRTVFVSWASPARARNPRVLLEAGTGAPASIHARERTYTDGMNAQMVFTYHARLDGLTADRSYRYSVTADNSRTAFSGSFRTAPRDRAAFRWTSFGDLATPVTTWALSSPQSRHAVDAVERFQPLFHLMNGDLCYANLNPHAQPAVWADFGNNVQRSAGLRPWMPCPGNHEIEFGNGAQGLDAYLTRYSLPDNGTRFPGCWYRFRVGSALFISLAADDVVYQNSGAFHAGPAPLTPAAGPPIAPGASIYVRGYSGGAQTRWLEQTLAAASRDRDIDWIVVQMHQDALSSSRNGNGSDKGIRESWLPLFDRYGVDLVLCGHDHDYERSWPVRGCNHGVGRDTATGATVDTCQPRPVMTAEPAGGRYDTRQGTVHLILGGGGTSAPLDAYGQDSPDGTLLAKVITRANHPRPGSMPGVFVKPGADAVEQAIWSAVRDTHTGYGIAVFDLDPGEPGGHTTITMRYYHAPGADRVPTPDYRLFDTLVLSKPRRDVESA
ncbi:MAG TPA: metallophosphoesterase family protein [Steroidobacteraceae bacterium]|nr:metallophosphoesterase family protein [Steroidobacteraceae bacterium]